MFLRDIRKLIKIIAMIRKTKYSKFLLHIIYILIFSYIIQKRSYKITTVHQIKRYIKDLKHILIWTELPGVTYDGQKEFIDRRCNKYNCYFTRNRTLFGDMRYFDAIVFNVQQVNQGAEDLPKLRGHNQKYIFAANDSAVNFPVCHPVYDGFFNWTWTYRKDSTIPYKFVSVHTLEGHLLDGEIRWRGNMKKLEEYRRRRLDTKSKAAAIFLDKCQSKSRREEFVRVLQIELAKYNQTVDIYGKCGPLKCKRKTMAPCNYRIQKNYFFYLALEDSIALDFVSDEVLHAYKNDAVPIVFGGENYLSIIPQGSYVDARQFRNISSLAKKMHRIITHKQLYYDMFKWKHYYTVGNGNVLDPCQLCEELNAPSMLYSQFSFKMFRLWWNSQYEFSCA